VLHFLWRLYLILMRKLSLMVGTLILRMLYEIFCIIFESYEVPYFITKVVSSTLIGLFIAYLHIFIIKKLFLNEKRELRKMFVMRKVWIKLNSLLAKLIKCTYCIFKGTFKTVVFKTCHCSLIFCEAKTIYEKCVLHLW